MYSMGWSMCACLLAVFIGCVVSSAPKYVWPLGNMTVHREVMAGQDAHLPASSQCFVYSEGVQDLPYTALTLSGESTSFVDFYLNGRNKFTDLAISLYIYPIGAPQGTILNYLCETGNVLKLAVLEGLLFVSFWDEYGVSVGATALPGLLEADAWNHLLVSREFDTGRIKVYHNGEKVDDIDDDFPNQIRLPVRGSMRLGSSQKEQGEINFAGRFACFQFWMSVPSDEEAKDAKKFCLPDAWKVVPEITLAARVIASVQMQCLTDYVEPSIDGSAEPKDCDVIDRGCLYSGVNWKWMLRKYQLSNSDRNEANFRLVTRDHMPADDSDITLADVTVAENKICPRLCLRVQGCHSYGLTRISGSGNGTRCVMYSKQTEAPVFTEGAGYFSVV